MLSGLRFFVMMPYCLSFVWTFILLIFLSHSYSKKLKVFWDLNLPTAIVHWLFETHYTWRCQWHLQEIVVFHSCESLVGYILELPQPFQFNYFLWSVSPSSFFSPDCKALSILQTYLCPNHCYSINFQTDTVLFWCVPCYQLTYGRESCSASLIANIFHHGMFKGQRKWFLQR